MRQTTLTWEMMYCVCVCVYIENYERLEADKKKQVQKKRRFEGPTIRYHSVLMSEPPIKDENVDVEGYAHARTHSHSYQVFVRTCENNRRCSGSKQRMSYQCALIIMQRNKYVTPNTVFWWCSTQ